MLDKLQQQIASVLLMYRALKEKNETLQATNNTLQKELEQNKKTIDDLQRNYAELHTAQAVIGSQSDAGEAKKRIEELVREVDECIALLR